MPAERGPVTAAVRPAPLPTLLVQLALPVALWGLVVLGRGVCLLAQRVPPLVWLVRAVYRYQEARRASADDARSQDPERISTGR